VLEILQLEVLLARLITQDAEFCEEGLEKFVPKYDTVIGLWHGTMWKCKGITASLLIYPTNELHLKHSIVYV
jgi:hypothetical protein